VIIRPVEAHEIAALSALASRSYADAFGASMSRAELAAQLAATRSEAYFAKATHADTILVAVVDEAIVGYVQLSDVRIPIDGAGPSDQELFALYVRTDRHGQGIGRALMDAAFAHARFKQAPSVWLDVWDQNARAIALYTRYGFRPAGRRDFVVDGKVVGHDLVMKRQR
jgi:diamine N-acetyltransferase